MILPGETEMYYDISWMGDTQYYFSLNAPGYGWSDWVTSEDGPIGFSITISEFDCDPYFYSYMRQESQFSGWHYYEYAYLYPETDCLEEAGGISLESRMKMATGPRTCRMGATTCYLARHQ